MSLEPYLRRLASLLPAELNHRLAPPATDDELVALAHQLGVEFPASLLTLYRWHGGPRVDQGGRTQVLELAPGWRWLPLVEVPAYTRPLEFIDPTLKAHIALLVDTENAPLLYTVVADPKQPEFGALVMSEDLDTREVHYEDLAHLLATLIAGLESGVLSYDGASGRLLPSGQYLELRARMNPGYPRHYPARLQSGL